MELVDRLEDALESAIARYEFEGEDALRRHYGRGPTTHVAVRDGRRFDAALLSALMLADTRHEPEAFRLGDVALGALRAAGVQVVALSEWSVEDELRWRLDAWRAIQARPRVDSRWLRDRRLYGGQQGIWSDKRRTEHLSDVGIAVSVRHTGRHYPDEVDGDTLLYRYPHTARAPSHDANEIESVKAAADQHLPVFVISELPGGARQAQLAWVVAWDDSAGAFLMTFAEAEPKGIDFAPPAVDAPFILDGPRRRRRVELDVLARDPEFKFRVLRRYGGRCAITGLAVAAVLDAAHVVPVDEGGTDDERNGLLLTANLHRALDAHLWALEPSSLRVVTRERGPSVSDLHVQEHTLRPGVDAPHRDALDWRYRRFKERSKEPLDGVIEELAL